MKNIKENISKESIQAIPLFVAYAIYLYFSKNNTEIFFEIVEIFCASIAGSIVVISGMQKEYKSFYKSVGGNEGEKCNYPTRLDLYGKGCYHDCSYCYAKSLLNFRKL